MKEFKYVVTDNEGIHARPAGELVKLVKGFESKITIEKMCIRDRACMVHGLDVNVVLADIHHYEETKKQK